MTVVPRRPLVRHRVVAALVLMMASAGLVACSRPSPPAEASTSPAAGSSPAPASPAAAPANTAPAPANPAAAPAGAPGGDVRALTGGRTRVVWVQGDGSDPTASGRNLALMAFDTDDSRGERPILAERGSYIKPLLIAGGQRVLFTRRQTSAADIGVYVVGWDGSGLRKLTDGAALAVWQEPGSGRDWLYLGTQNSDASPGDFKVVSRFPVDQPAAREVVWNKTPVSGDTFQVSADGKLAGGLFPWPKAGVVTLPNGDLRLFGDGCWTAMRDAGVPLAWYFDGSHRNVTMVDPKADRRWTVALNQAPGFAGAEVYHPRWANHPRFVAISGPYNQGGANQVRTGGAQTEIYLGRFSRDYATVEAWARVTRNGGGDSYPDVWIDRSSNAHPIELVRSAPKTAPVQGADRVVVEARMVTSAAIPSPRSIAPYRNALVANVYEVVKVVEGKYSEGRIVIAQWAIRDAAVLEEARQRVVGSVVRLTVERYEAHPELEGERLIVAPGAPDMPMFYDVTPKP
jgi:hypothetical protein